MSIWNNNIDWASTPGTLRPGRYGARSTAPQTGVQGYLDYITNVDEFMVNKDQTPEGVSPGPSYDNRWYKFLTKPMSYKNEVILEQGTVANGYSASSVFNTIHRILNASDTLQLTGGTTSFTSRYGGWHSTKLAAYYHQGNNGDAASYGANKQDWATMTVVSIADRPSLSGAYMNSIQPGPVAQNTFGVLQQGTSGCYLTFSTDSWTSSGYGISASTYLGWGSFGANFGYTWNYGYSNVYKINWSVGTWTQTSSGNPAASDGAAGKSLNTKWNKFYHAGSNSILDVSRYNNSNDTWSTTGSQVNPQTEQCGVMGQDWGYWLGGYGPAGSWSGQNQYSQKTFYSTDTTFRLASADGQNALSSGNGCWGPIP